MIIPILSIVAMASIALFIAPTMPLYSVRDIQLAHIGISRSLTLSAKLFTGMEVQNDNVLGADLYSTHVDIYYPDWNGVLQHIGHLEETESIATNNNDDPLCNDKGGEDDDRGICIPMKGGDDPVPVPFFSVQPRGKSTSSPGAVTVYLNNVYPSTYLHIFYDLLINAGTIEILISGVAHVKSPLGIPLSLGLVCDNTLSLLKFPIEIFGNSCIIEKISTGWSGLQELADEVKDSVMDYYDQKDGDIFNRRRIVTIEESGFLHGSVAQNKIRNKDKNAGVLEIENEMGDILSLESILDWHDF